jgi:hypothetical protein
MTAMSPADVYPAPAVPYATPAPKPGAKVWAGAAILFGGLCLILLGGCFLIGVMGLVHPASMSFAPNGAQAPQPRLTAPQTLLMAMLYLLAFASFAGAAWMLAVGTRGLLKVMRAT